MDRPLSHFSPGRHGFAVATAAATLALVGVGGLVTSHGVGMAVPDWPNTYGYNMFFFPFSRWVGGVFYEHSHRLVASGVGLLTTILAIWLYGKNARPLLRWAGAAMLAVAMAAAAAYPRHRADNFVLAMVGLAALGSSAFWPSVAPAPRWIRRLGLVAFFAVVIQGILGGLRVVLFKDQIGIFHATLAQLFFALTCVLALVTSRWWEAQGEAKLQAPGPAGSRVRWVFVGATALILIQLILGAAMRHQHAGLSIPDFPLAYGKLWPAMDSQAVAHYNQQRLEVTESNPITAVQIALQMGHRLVALLILGAVVFCAWISRRSFGPRAASSRLALAWVGLVLVQALLGAATILTNKAADVATAHVLVGAACLACGTLLTVTAGHQRASTRPAPSSSPNRPVIQPTFAPRSTPAASFE